ncbi:MAG: protein translocase subunit SecF [Succinivibrio sp.]|nr:protein translocase subunit SecF [Succinivibrio sp.]
MIQFIKSGTVIPFMRIKGLVEIVCVAMVVASIVSMCVRGLNWGLDFTGGIVVETEFPQNIDLEQVRDAYAAEGIEGATQHFGTAKDVVVRVAPKEGLDQQSVTNKVMRASRSIDENVKLSRSEYVGPAVGEELVQSGILAIVVSLIAILAYIAFRFEWRMATGAVISLTYDVIVVMGVFSFFLIEYDLTVLASVLTVVGYSLNDKIVVFDRIRENATKLSRSTSMENLFDVSLTQTLARTIITSGTTLITVVSLLIFGGEMIYGFALALFVGIIFGTISSIYVASTWALILGIKRVNLVPKKIEKKETDGMETMD